MKITAQRGMVNIDTDEISFGNIKGMSRIIFKDKNNKTRIMEGLRSTGLSDCRGTPIYEGDILGAPDGTKYRVFWHDTRAMFALDPLEDKRSKYIEPWDDWSVYRKIRGADIS